MNDPAEILADDATDDVETSEKRKKADWLEIGATVLLGIAAVLIAFSTFQAQLWGGVQDTRNTASSTTSVQASAGLGRADATVSLDQLLFADWIPAIVGAIEANEALDQGASSTEEAALRAEAEFLTSQAGFLKSQMSVAGKQAATSWLDNPLIRPFDEGAYTFATYGEGLAEFEASAALFDMATTANGNSDNYTLAATICALVLFLSGVSLVLNGHTTRMVLVVGSGLILAGVAAYVVGLPRHAQAQTVEEITDRAVLKANGKLFIPTQGEAAFTVYLEVADDPDADFTDLVDFYGEEGYSVLVGNVSCDAGAAEALGVDSDAFAAGVYFATADDADEFVTEYQLSEETIVEIRSECAVEPDADSLDLTSVNPTLGDEVVGVYLDVSDDANADFTDVVDFYRQEGYTAFPGPVACDRGAAEALGVDDDHAVVAIYFANFEAASSFAAEYELSDETIIDVQIDWC